MSASSRLPDWKKRAVRATRSIRALVIYPLWVFAVFICAIALFGGVQFGTMHVPGILGLLQLAGVPLRAINPSILTLIITVVIWTVVLVVVIFVPRLAAHKRTTNREELGIKRLLTWGDIGLGVVAFIPYIVGAAVLLYFMQKLVPGFDVGQVQETGFDTGVTSQLNRVMAFLALVVIGPVIEELLFRGYLYSKLRRYGVIVATIVVSVVFALLHGQWNIAVDVFVLSFVLCVLRELTGNIWAGIVLHMLKNGIAYYMLFIAPLLLH